MPIYEYHCNDCGSEEEIFFRSISSVENPTKCPKCNSENYVRKMSVALFDVVGGTMHTIGKRNWKQNLTVEQQANVLNGDAAPY
jgi:putative FmdB family regulatory protein